MIDLFYEFLGLSTEIPWFIQYFVVLSILFMSVWVVCSFINLLISSIFSIFK